MEPLPHVHDEIKVTGFSPQGDGRTLVIHIFRRYHEVTNLWGLEVRSKAFLPPEIPAFAVSAVTAPYPLTPPGAITSYMDAMRKVYG